MAPKGYRLRNLSTFRSGVRDWEGRSLAGCYGGAYRAAYRLGRGVALTGAALLCLGVIVGLWVLAVGMGG